MSFVVEIGPHTTDMPAFVCDLSGVKPTAATVDALARLALSLSRCGCRLRVRHASPELRELIAFMGLTDALGLQTRR